MPDYAARSPFEDAMIDKGKQTGLCTLRIALALTTGYLNTSKSTVYRRATKIVNMDKSAGVNSNESMNISLEKFASRYMNAVRLGMDKIIDWNKTAEVGDITPVHVKIVCIRVNVTEFLVKMKIMVCTH